MDNWQTALRQLCFSLAPMPEDAWQAFAQPWTEVRFRRKELLTRTGDTEKYLYFILDGVQRAFYAGNDKEPTLVFTYALSFSGVLDSFLNQQPSRYHLEALTATRCMRMHHADFMAFRLAFPEAEKWLATALAQVLAGTLERQVELLAFSAEEKFTALLSRSPHVLNLIPHKYLASYIGVDPATFSKMLGSVKL